MTDNFFPARPNATPTIYAYTDVNFPGLIKVGYTTTKAAERVAQQYPVAQPTGRTYTIVLEEHAVYNHGGSFMDHDVHRQLVKMGVEKLNGEWFRCSAQQVHQAISAVRHGDTIEPYRTMRFGLRPEQAEAIERTASYFESARKQDPKKTPHFLWNAKMRFGKTFTAYKLAQRMGWKKLLILTFKPAVQHAWKEDLQNHVDFEGWQFIAPRENALDALDKSRPIVCFGSFQDYLGRNTSTGGLKTKNEWVHTINWDCIILDEYHYGSWRENAKELFEGESTNEQRFGLNPDIEVFDEGILPITTNAFLYLSGTPFRAIASGEFIEEQIYNWTYADEQAAKTSWNDPEIPNPYASLPRMVLMTYQLPDSIREVALQGQFNEFDLNVFFSAKGEGAEARFVYEDEVQKWLELIRGSFTGNISDELKLGHKKPPMPFSDVRLKDVLAHTFWFLPSVAACYAMEHLLKRKQNGFYHDFNIIVAAGTRAGIGAQALPPVYAAMGNPLQTKTITLSCGKLTTGVTVKPWTGIFMLRNLTSPETYFQAAFRVQSPWTIMNSDGLNPNREEILKPECYIFDFAPNRALQKIADYSCRLNVGDASPEQKVAEFINFLPVLAYDGSSMKQIDAAGILDMAMSGTTATLLARRWESALLVNVDNNTLSRLLNNAEAMAALESIEAFRNLNKDLETIINKSEAVKKAKKDANDEEITPTKRRELTEAEKEQKSERKRLQEKLIKFATRIPVFMYLTDYREYTLVDVITKVEPGLFRRVTGLKVKDFELLLSLGVFNGPMMNDAVYKFKRYEDASLSYSGIDKHEGKNVGLFNTVISRAEFEAIEEIE